MSLPLVPGVYIMRNSQNKIIYIGKAKALKNRVSQYFGSHTSHSPKVIRMVENVNDFDYIITDSEFEALVLECSLIKQHQPHYNILLKDDKGYHYLRISNEEWSRITVVKKVANDNAEYIGPYMSYHTVSEALAQARKIFKIPDCDRKFPQDIGKGRACLNYHIKLCNAPCIGKISLKEYRESIDEAVKFLKGENNTDIKKMTEEMQKASESLNFERAAKIRDRIFAVQKLKENQKVVFTSIEEQDIIALIMQDNKVSFEVFNFRQGKLFDRENFILDNADTTEQTRSDFILQYYSLRNYIPKRIALDGDIVDKELIEKWLSEKSGRKVSIVIPKKGEQYKLVQMCRNNAGEHLAQKKGYVGKEIIALNDLGNLLGLAKTPVYIESYDISNQSGTANVAGMVVFENGRPLKSAYRKFEIKTVVGQDDYASMAEVMERRLDEYEKHKDENSGFGRLPDLILLDGGKGQIHAVAKVLAKKGYDFIPLFGMVKDGSHKTRAITSSEKEITIKNNRNVFTLVSTIQEEVHRFAIGYHRKKRKLTAFKSSLTEIEGVGEKRAKALLKYFGSIENIRSADIPELEKMPSITKTVAENIYRHFH
ncbi:MAG: excinuclease ABC subunit UvrC [Clostridia bacterium]|nr:excinuclease ABC subunit UvrC [Clostridia bacterium]